MTDAERAAGRAYADRLWVREPPIREVRYSAALLAPVLSNPNEAAAAAERWRELQREAGLDRPRCRMWRAAGRQLYVVVPDEAGRDLVVACLAGRATDIDSRLDGYSAIGTWEIKTVCDESVEDDVRQTLEAAGYRVTG